MMRARRGMQLSALGLLAACVHPLTDVHADPPPTAAQSYNPAWAGELNWTTNNLFHAPLGSMSWLEERDVPWWQNRVVAPIQDYSGDRLPTGSIRLDTALDLEVTMHQALPGWRAVKSPTGINYVWDNTTGSVQEDRSTRSGQNGYLNFGAHPIESITAQIGAEFTGNYDQRYWFPNNDELRMYNDNTHAKIVTGEIKYDDKTLMMRGFEAVPHYGWVSQNDLFALLPTTNDPEYYRQLTGDLAPRGGEFRYKSDRFGTLDVLGGSEIQLRYGSSLFAKYDFPTFRNWENTVVYRNQNVPYNLSNPDERQWSVSYNSSYPFSDRSTGHFGILYQPFRIGHQYTDVDSNGNLIQQRTLRRDAFGATTRMEFKPERYLDEAGAGYTYEGPVAGNKHQVDLDAGKALLPDWTLSGAYIYRQPVRGPVPLTYQGTPDNPGALISSPRGPDDPFAVQWDNRKAHIGTLTLIFDPTPGTAFFKYQKNNLDAWNLNADEDAMWTGAVQYRVTEYPTNTDRLYFWDEAGNLIWDPVYHSGALATNYPFSSATGVVRWTRDDWHVSWSLSGGQALAGAGIAYSPTATNFYKPSTTFVDSVITVMRGPWQTFFRYGQDEYGPFDYFIQNGWAYHHIYQAGLSYQFLKMFEAGFRYTGTRMNEWIGSPTGAFNEYRAYLTWHFSLQHDFGSHLASLGKPLPQTFPEASVSVSDTQFTPGGSGSVRQVVITPQGSAEAGVLSYKILVRNSQGETVKEWNGSGSPQGYVSWDGVGSDGRVLPAGNYQVTLNVVDLYGNEVTSPAQTVQLVAAAPEPAKSYLVTTTPEGLRVTLSSLVLFDLNQRELKESSRQALDQVYELLKTYPTNTLRVTGYTDSSGSQAYNQKLSEQRAKAVADYLVHKGITAPRIKAVGMGERRPMATNTTEEGRQQNRRVEIDILK